MAATASSVSFDTTWSHSHSQWRRRVSGSSSVPSLPAVVASRPPSSQQARPSQGWGSSADFAAGQGGDGYGQAPSAHALAPPRPLSSFSCTDISCERFGCLTSSPKRSPFLVHLLLQARADAGKELKAPMPIGVARNACSWPILRPVTIANLDGRVVQEPIYFATPEAEVRDGSLSSFADVFQSDPRLWGGNDFRSYFGGESLGVTRLHRFCFSLDRLPPGRFPKLLETLKTLLANRADLNAKAGVHQLTPLRSVAESHSPLAPSLLRFLVAQQADVEQCDRAGVSPVIAATRGKHVENVRALAECGASVDAAIMEASKMTAGGGEVALHLGHIYFVFEALFATTVAQRSMSDVDRCAEKREGRNLGELTSEKVQALLKEGDCVEMAATGGGSPFWLACKRSDLWTADALYHAQAKIDAADDRGRTALHDAAQRGDSEVVGWLLDVKASVDEADKAGRTPLMLASTPEVRALLRPAATFASVPDLARFLESADLATLLAELPRTRCRDMLFGVDRAIQSCQAMAVELYPAMAALLKLLVKSIDERALAEGSAALTHLLEATRGPEADVAEADAAEASSSWPLVDSRLKYRDRLLLALEEASAALAARYAAVYVAETADGKGSPVTVYPARITHEERMTVTGALHQDAAHGALPWLQRNSIVEMFLALRAAGAVGSLEEFACFLRDTDSEHVWQHAYCKWLCATACNMDDASHRTMCGVVRAIDPSAEYLRHPPKRFSRHDTRLRDTMDALRIANAKQVLALGEYGLRSVPGYLTDLLSSTVVCPDLESLDKIRTEMLELSVETDGVEVVLEENGFSRAHRSKDGYRTWKCFLLIDSRRPQQCRLFAELELNVRHMLSAKHVGNLIDGVRGGAFETEAYKRASSTLLFEECSKITDKSPGVILRLLRRNGDPNTRGEDGTSCLLRLCFCARRCPGPAHTSAVKILLSARADPNRAGGCMAITPLHVVARINDDVAATLWQFLIDYAADPESRTRDGLSPLDVARRDRNPRLLDAAASRRLSHVHRATTRSTVSLSRALSSVVSGKLSPSAC